MAMRGQRGHGDVGDARSEGRPRAFYEVGTPSRAVFVGRATTASAPERSGLFGGGSPTRAPYRTRTRPMGCLKTYLGEGEFAYKIASDEVLRCPEATEMRRARRPDEIRVPILFPANGVSDRQLFGTDDLREICLSKYKSEDYSVCELCKRNGDCALAGRLVPVRDEGAEKSRRVQHDQADVVWCWTTGSTRTARSGRRRSKEHTRLFRHDRAARLVDPET